MIDKERMQRAEDSLTAYRNQIEIFLSRYIGAKANGFKEVESLGEEAGRLIEDFILNGGKRIRAAFTYYGYRAAGGEDGENILFASAAIEILHNFFLIHDDIVDKSDLRRGLPTMHARYKQIYENKGLISNFNNYGKMIDLPSAMAIINGNICCALAYEALVESGFQADKILQVLKMMYDIIRFTAVGQLLDIVKATSGKATEEDVLRIHYLKTAKYSMEAPLCVGAVLKGTTLSVLDSLSRYAIPVGIAFQIHDDILGIFGTEEQVGKSIASDTKESKQTLLTVKAFENASPSQKERLKYFIGNPDITKADMEELKSIIEETGALEYSRMKEISLTEEGKKALLDTPIQEDIKDILLGTADLLIEREY
jgi:geranylgeranyl diphosphate synthase type I